MIVIFFLTLILFSVAIPNNNEQCPLAPNLFTNKHTEDFSLYFYIPHFQTTFYPNSIDIIDQNGKLVECISTDQFKHDNNLNISIYAFQSIYYINENLYAIGFVEEKTFERLVRNNIQWLFADANLKMRHDLGIIKMGPQIESQIFSPGDIIDLHDIYINDEMTHAIIIIKQSTLITDVKEHFPDALIDSFSLISQGLCTVDLMTGKEISAFSADGIFMKFEEWYNYIYANSQKYFTPLPGTEEENIEDQDYDEYFSFIHVNSVKHIDGSHFSPKFNNKKLFMIYAKNSCVTYLIDWDYKQKENDKLDIIWALPSAASPEVIRREWMDKWEYIGDPFYGTSGAHHANIRNLPKGHILYHDNGAFHFISDGNGDHAGCPISRVVEYKIEMDYEKEGYHRITLVFSYPKVSEYADLIVRNSAYDYDEDDCIEIWDKYNFQQIVGSVDKIEDKYLMTYFSYFITFDVEIDRYYGHKMLMVDSDGEIVNQWESTDYTISYKITPIDKNSFRNGIYSNAKKEYEI